MDIIPIKFFGKDHWSTLAYAETVMVETGKGFQIGYDPRMRQNRRHFRIMKECCPRPGRPVRCNPNLGVVMESRFSTILRDGSVVENHDDWQCVQDLAYAGIFKGEVEPGKFLKLTPYGKVVVGKLREHKANGGSFGNFTMEG